MSRLFGISINTVHGGNAASGSLTDEEPHWASPAWNYYRRSERTVTDPVSFYSLWPRSSYFISDPSSPGMAPMEAEENWTLQWDFINGDGHPAQKYIIGTVKDANGVAVAGAVVKSYLASNDVEAGSTTSGVDGSYRCPTPYTGAHYCVAYLAGGTPTAGTTVNTLTPTNNDGA